jgi:hypothetical protein
MIGGTLDITADDEAVNGNFSILPAAYEWETEDDDGEYPVDTFTYNNEKEVTITAVPLTTRIYSTGLSFNKGVPADISFTYTLAADVTLENVQIDSTNVAYTPGTNSITIDDSVLSVLSLGSHTVTLLTDSAVDPTVTLTVTAVYPFGLVLDPATKELQYDDVEVTSAILGGGSYSYNTASNTLTLTNVNFTTTSASALILESFPGITISLVGNNALTATGASAFFAINSEVSFSLAGNGSLTAAGYLRAFDLSPTISMTSYTWEAFDATDTKTSGTNNYVYSQDHKKVTIAYRTPAPVDPAPVIPDPVTPDPVVPSPTDPDPNPDSGSSGNSNRVNVAPPPKKEYAEPDEPEDDKTPDDNTNTERGISTEVNGVQSDVKVAMPTEANDKTADVTINGKSFETHSLTAAEAIADGEVSKVIVSESGAIAAVTKSGNVIAGANGTESLNSASTIEALEAAVEDIEVEITDDGETETPLITIMAGQEVTGVSDNTIEKIITVANEYGVNTQIQKSQYSEDENGQIDKLIYRITIPVDDTGIRDIRLGAEFSTAVVEASIIAFEKTFGNTDCAGFALTQKETFGVTATIQVKMSAIGFKAKPGDTVYVAIFNPVTGEFTQVEGIVGENGFITFKTDKSGVIIISATPFAK